MAQVVRIQVNGQILWEVAKTSSDHWLAVCRPLNLTMEGTSLDELHASINDAVQLLLSDLMESGELDAFLKSRNWQRVDTPGTQQGEVEFDVPVEVLIRSNHGSARALLQ